VCRSVSKSRKCGGNLYLNNKPRSGKPVILPHDLNGEETTTMTRTTHDEFVHKNRRISRSAIAENFNTGIGSINVNIACLFNKKKCARL
jgi:hypothetical protein